MRTNRLLVPTHSVSGEVSTTREISFTEWGDPQNPHVVVCIHGLTRNCRDFDFLASALEAEYRVFCVDVVGRGQSDWLDKAEDYDNYHVYLSDAASLLAHIRTQYSCTIKLDWVGISMGGLIGMLLATDPEIPVPIHKLIMSDIGPLIPVASLQRMSDYVGKDQRFKNFSEFETYIRKISESFGPLTDEQWHHLAKYSFLKNQDGTYSFGYDPNISVSFEKHVLQEDIDLWEYWDKLEVPTLVVRGIESDVLQAGTAAEMKLRGPKAKIIELPGVGHAPILLDDEQIEIVKNFLLA